MAVDWIIHVSHMAFFSELGDNSRYMELMGGGDIFGTLWNKKKTLISLSKILINNSDFFNSFY